MEQTNFALKTNGSPVELVDDIIRQGSICSASDIHIEPREHRTIIRMRIDGVIKEVSGLGKTLHEPLISRLKILAGLRTDIRYSAQDGRFKFKPAPPAQGLDIRLSLVPTYFGEKAVLRLLSNTLEKKRSFESLGFSKKHQEEINRALASAHGMILVVGPTGSGKTTTLYTMLETLLDKEISIVTLEDPIEYIIEKATQIPVHIRGAFSFAQALRSVVRQDPDVIMVGEMRDSETAKLAVQSALTGHLLLSTLHTTSAAATLPRLLDMGIESYLLAGTIRLVVAQRLVRRVCTSCKTHKTQDMPVGCDRCRGTGYSGRVSINELLIIDDEIRKLIETKTPSSVIDEYMVKKGSKMMLDDGLEKVSLGITTKAEVLEAISD